jgi:UDP-N-acetyl-D-galactosamine dehydrogenase
MNYKYSIKPCVFGLGYVGLPVLLSLTKNFDTCGFDIDKKRILDLKRKKDKFREFSKKELNILTKSKLSFSEKDLKKYNFFIICVPTPVKKKKIPDLSPLILACEILSKVIKKKDIIVFESTVYPGTTEEICLKIIEKKSKLKMINGDFDICYSPERINPGDKKHSLKQIDKVISVPNSKIIKKIKIVYRHLSKKLFFSKNIREAETSKVIENIQRDLNIALMNEIYIFCEKFKINFYKVHKLASTKWNFGRYSPGLVGGHCLPVDPYYFSHIAKKKKLITKVTLAGRDTNENMGKYIIKKIKLILKKNKIDFSHDKILFAGLTYKKNVGDLRNSQAYKIFQYFRKFNKNILSVDPFVITNKYMGVYNTNAIKSIKNIKCLFVLVEHSIFKKTFVKLSKIPSFNVFHQYL